MLTFAETQSNAAMEGAIGRRLLALIKPGVVDFASGGGKKCTKGLSCGGSCISKAKVCIKAMNPAQKQEYRSIVKAAKAGDTEAQGKVGKIKSEQQGTADVTKKSKIESISAFTDTALTQIQKLDKDENLGGLVPIHKLRDALGDSVSKSDFNDWLQKMQADDAVQLIGGEMPGLNPEIASKSITTALGAPRYYVKALKSAGSAGVDVSGAKPNTVNAKIKPLKTEADFASKAKDVIKTLDKEENLGGLVPIHKLRDALGDAVSKSDFNDWLQKMQADDAVQLIGGELPGLTPELASKSITTALGAPRYYVKIN